MAHAYAVGTFNTYMATKNNKNKIIYHLKIPCQHLKKIKAKKKKKKNLTDYFKKFPVFLNSQTQKPNNTKIELNLENS